MSIPSAQPLPSASPSLPPPPAARVAPSVAPEAAGALADTAGAASAPKAEAERPGGIPNPTSRMDPALGIVVLEFRDQRGTVRSIPTERELEAYRQAASRQERTEDQMRAGVAPMNPAAAAE